MKYLHHRTEARQARACALKATTHVLSALILRLPLLERQVIIGWFYEGRTMEELADRLGQPVATIRAAVKQGVNLLRQDMAARPLASLATHMVPDRDDLDSDLARPRQASKDAAAR
jgi:DNA-directed RNA polymerase specialized sigma24 family protein